MCNWRHHMMIFIHKHYNTLIPTNTLITYLWGLGFVIFLQYPTNKRQFGFAVVTFLLCEIGVTKPLEHVVEEILFSVAFCAALISSPTLGQMFPIAFGLTHSLSHRIVIILFRIMIPNVCRPFLPQLPRQVDSAWSTVLVRTNTYLDFMYL